MKAEHVIVENWQEWEVSPELAEMMVEAEIIYPCNRDHADDAHYYHLTIKFTNFATI